MILFLYQHVPQHSNSLIPHNTAILSVYSYIFPLIKFVCVCVSEGIKTNNVAEKLEELSIKDKKKEEKVEKEKTTEEKTTTEEEKKKEGEEK